MPVGVITLPLAFFTPGPSEMLLVAVIALLVFGKDLPSVAKQWGKAFQEFRRHLNGIRSELNDAINAEPERPRLQYHPQYHARQETPPASAASTNGDAHSAPADEPNAPDMPSD